MFKNGEDNMNFAKIFKQIKSEKLRNTAQNIIYSVCKVLYRVFYIYPIKSNRIVLSNFNGRAFGDNPKYLALELMKRGGFELIWLVRSGVDAQCPEGIKVVNIMSFEGLKAMATAKVWIANNRQPYYISKRKGQYYLQTWHGCMGFKKIERDMRMPSFYKRQSLNDSKMMDLLIVNSKMSEQIFKGFWYSGELYYGGAPRNDILLFPNSITNKVKAYFGLSEDTKIMLYAPTFRNNEDLSPYKMDYCGVKNALEERFGGKWIIMVRLHPVLMDKEIIDGSVDYIIDATKYPDVQELLSAACVCVTDYSSVIFDFMLKSMPSFIYATDYDSYVNERGFYNDPKKLPFKYTENSVELIEAIRAYDDVAYQKELSLYKERIGLSEYGHATKEVADRIIKWMKS